MARAGILTFLYGVFADESVSTAGPTTSQSLQTIPLLQAALNYDPNPSKGGGDITVVNGALLADAGPSGTIADISDHPKSSQISLHVVREGETLSQIADLYGVTTNTIIWANDIKHVSAIQPGQQLLILPISGVRHMVKKGDSLQSIAKKYSGNLDEILRYNDLSEDSQLSIGQVIVVPDGEIGTPARRTKVAQKTNGGSIQSTGNQGYYIRPISGGRKTQGIHGYNAVDLANSAGTPIVAAAAGTVLISRDYGWNGGYGHYIVIKHDNGSQTLYAHCSKNIVSAGEYVRQGQVIGYVGSTGKSTGPHVHFEIRNGIRNPF